MNAAGNVEPHRLSETVELMNKTKRPEDPTNEGWPMADIGNVKEFET